MFDPISTYRIQFNKDFTFKDFDAIIPYLQELGIKTIYASPVYEAVPGSMHGYDVVNPNRINPEIGTIEELTLMSAKLKAAGMSWIQDIVPNHMGFDHRNEWLMDVLKNGEDSAYRSYFDLISPDLRQEPLMVPFLGDELDTVIKNGALELVTVNGEQFVKYFENYWPVRTDQADRSAEKSDVGVLAKKQYYRLCCHKETNERINYRRFFTVNSLICLNIQHAEVFEDYHRLTRSLLDLGVFQGLRIDHVDGLADPGGYLQQLRKYCGEDVYIVVEKILEPGEKLLNDWPVQGTTGYDFLGLVNQLHTNQKAEEKFDAFYKDLGRNHKPVQLQILNKKRVFLNMYMQGELENLYKLLLSLKLLDPKLIKGKKLLLVKELIGELLVRCPVYRFYSRSYPFSAEENEALELIFSELERDDRYGQLVSVVRTLFLDSDQRSPDFRERIAVFYRRLMQFSGPLMAKGVEDTLMYTFNRFIGNNEVGDSPEVFGISVTEFHEQIETRQHDWPHTMNTTATHDTKRGEDARARLTVLTDLRQEWIEEVKVWQDLNIELKADGKPDVNDEYFIYQTLIATYPEQDASSENYSERLLDYIEKALRESKRNSAWDEPDLAYESATKAFISGLLDDRRDFWSRFSVFLKKVAAHGRIVSLSTLMLKFMLPGVPDTYQGTELWDLSMVDPDNRRPVDYELRTKMLARFSRTKPSLRDLWAVQTDGSVKLFLTRLMLRLRQQESEIFSKGQFVPLKVTGKKAGHILAFARCYQGNWLLCVVPVSFASLPGSSAESNWENTRVILPADLPGNCTNMLTGENLVLCPGNDIVVADLFAEYPLGMLMCKKLEQKRGAGILMPVYSLPSAFGIGDFGPAAFTFLNFLSDQGMKYWQVLPMNPVSSEQIWSPYSASSVMAGNILLISPELLHEAGLLGQDKLEAYRQKVKRQVDYAEVSRVKSILLGKAFQQWLTDDGLSSPEFTDFCRLESGWLDDYALFEVIRELQDNQPWMQWPVDFRDRNVKTMSDLREDYDQRISELKWQQFMFFGQWKSLRDHAARLDIKIIGDIPFYTALNSADVWTNRDLFAVTEDGQMAAVAGVPPDYFNSEGQLWGMPVYNWKAMAGDQYKWWSARLAMNLKMYDMVRLDHFRAFSAYWEVPAGNDSAKSGSWKPGPGKAFFKVMQAQFGRLPLIAEDLGEISDEVYDLRDGFALPGMKVLQFAFGEDVSTSVHAPHNFSSVNSIVYTGTHDNNTSLGWYEKEADLKTKKRMESYMGMKLSRKNVVQQMIRLALASSAKVAIIPMQDVLNKPSGHRMNTPSSVESNWTWRVKVKDFDKLDQFISRSVKLYRR